MTATLNTLERETLEFSPQWQSMRFNVEMHMENDEGSIGNTQTLHV